MRIEICSINIVALIAENMAETRLLEAWEKMIPETWGSTLGDLGCEAIQVRFRKKENE